MRGVKVLFWLVFSLLLPGLIYPVQAQRFIWRIGKLDNKYSEFSWPETMVVDYLVPSNWGELLSEDDPNWGGFPQHLYTTLDDGKGDGEQRIQEISINFSYASDYHNPILVVRAETSDPDPNVYFALAIMKFNKRIPLGLMRMNNKYRFVNYEFPVGLIKGEDIDEKNEIIIRCEGPPWGYIKFDALYLYYDDTDSDQDGVWDRDEADARLDSRTTCLSRIGRDPADVKRFTFKIQEPEDIIPYFREVRFLDPNTLAGLDQLRSAYYFPYGFFAFRIDEAGPMRQVVISVAYEDTHNPEDKFSPLLCCFAYQGNTIWQEMDFSFLDSNSIRLKVEDGGNGDYDGVQDGSIDTIFTLSYPQKLDVTVDKKGCFLHSISWGK